MYIIKYPLFYVIGISLYLILNFRWRYVFRCLFLRPKVKKVYLKKVENVYKENERALVSIVQGNDTYTMLQKGLNILGGLDTLGIQGRTVLIKPNIVNRYKSPSNTNPLLLKNLVKVLHEHGASKVFIGDMSAIYTLPTIKKAEKSGIWEAIQEEDMVFLPFEEYGWVEVDIPFAKIIKKALVSEILFNVDRIINVPVIKTHSYANYSISLKNFVGATHPCQRPYFLAPEYWDEIIAELNGAYTPHVNILDGTKIFITGGPTRGKVAIPDLMVLSGDRIAADVVGISVINVFREMNSLAPLEIWEQRQIKRAKELQLGIQKTSELKIVSTCLHENKKDFALLLQKIHDQLTMKKTGGDN